LQASVAKFAAVQNTKPVFSVQTIDYSYANGTPPLNAALATSLPAANE